MHDRDTMDTAVMLFSARVNGDMQTFMDIATTMMEWDAKSIAQLIIDLIEIGFYLLGGIAVEWEMDPRAVWQAALIVRAEVVEGGEHE